MQVLGVADALLRALLGPVCEPVCLALCYPVPLGVSVPQASAHCGIWEAVYFVGVNVVSLHVCLGVMSQCGAAWGTVICVICSVTFWATAQWSVCAHACVCVCVCVCDWAVCCGVYSGALGATRCVCMSMEVEGRSTELTLPALVLRSAWAGLWASEPRVPSSTPLPAVPSGSRGRIQCLVLPTLFQHLWDRPIGQFKGLSFCLAVPAPDTLHLPHP